MILIAKKEFKDSVKEVMVDAIKNSRMPELTEKEQVSSDREIIRTLSRFYEEVVKDVVCKTRRMAVMTKKNCLN